MVLRCKIKILFRISTNSIDSFTKICFKIQSWTKIKIVGLTCELISNEIHFDPHFKLEITWPWIDRSGDSIPQRKLYIEARNINFEILLKTTKKGCHDHNIATWRKTYSPMQCDIARESTWACLLGRSTQTSNWNRYRKIKNEAIKNHFWRRFFPEYTYCLPPRSWLL